MESQFLIEIIAITVVVIIVVIAGVIQA